MKKTTFISIILAAWLTQLPQLAHAYIGPGAGLSAIGTLVALVGAVLLAIVGFVWYPLKRLLRKNNQARHSGDDSDNTSQ